MTHPPTHQERIGNIPARFVFESALELMSLTQVGSFSMKSPAAQDGEGGGGGSGPPPVVKALLSKFGSSKEEDRLKGYLSFLKIGPKILRLVPGKKAQDVRTWLEVYGYWNQGGVENVISLFLLLAQRFSLVDGTIAAPLKVVETPSQGLVHPLSTEIFQSPKKYLEWYLRRAAQRNPADGMVAAADPATAPRVAVLLYRKHVITNQLYIPQLLRICEREGLLPIPIFINGVEGHTVVRDLLTTKYERTQRALGDKVVDSLSSEAVEVDAIVNTIGFPLVGGPAGSMEAGRRVDVATRLLGAKNVPYFVSSPLLIQDIKSWQNNGVLGLQSAVLYSLPELDGAVDTVVLGGLVGDKIALVPERVRKLAKRIKGWHSLKATPAHDRKVSVLLYGTSLVFSLHPPTYPTHPIQNRQLSQPSHLPRHPPTHLSLHPLTHPPTHPPTYPTKTKTGFPPNVGAIGTAALLNVPRSLENLLKALQDQGYDTGLDAHKIDGEGRPPTHPPTHLPTVSSPLSLEGPARPRLRHRPGCPHDRRRRYLRLSHPPTHPPCTARAPHSTHPPTQQSSQSSRPSPKRPLVAGAPNTNAFNPPPPPTHPPTHPPTPAIVAILTAISQEAVVAGGPKRMQGMVNATTTFGGEMIKARITAEGVTPDALRAAVGDRTAERIEKMWGDLDGYVGLFTSQEGEFIVGGVQLGNVWIGVQPLLGIEGDPMRLLFERDLTPHPQVSHGLLSPSSSSSSSSSSHPPTHPPTVRGVLRLDAERFWCPGK